MVVLMARETLTRPRIIKAAIALLDRDGLEGLSIRELGRELGTAATALYWHVKNKDDLVRQAADAVWTEIALPPLERSDWRQAAKSMAQELYRALSIHPWLAQAFGNYSVYGPGKARHDDHSLAVYELAGFDEADADNAAISVFIFVLGHALVRIAGAPPASRQSGKHADAGDSPGERIAEVQQIAACYPRLRARLASVAMGDLSTPDDNFEFGLSAILDGLALRLASRQR